MVDEYKYLPGYAGVKAYTIRDTNMYADNIINHATEYNQEKGTFTYLTGWVAYAGTDNTYLLDIYGMWVHVNRNTMDWEFDPSDRKVLPKYSKSEAQRLVNKIIRNNQTILSLNLLCARYADKLTKEQRAQVVELQQRLLKRNAALQNDGLCEDLKSNYPAGYASLSPYLDRLMKQETGVGSVTVTIIVAAVVIASLSTAAYFAYKYYAAESEDDVKFSKELTETLMAKLTPEEYEQLKKETAGIVTKARIKQTLSTVGTEIKIIGAAAAVLGGYILYKQWQSRRN